ncbi:phosphate transport system substrate-binding protein [Nocardioides alpinus]|uniref:Phosphate-binding protein n=1 Tax=Nocardioides alpinus TaxID=748909 RepID=A0A1I0W6U1_9ACTN|nr:phosphate ABC transporter substrate-binding protein PstS [Nocardioides alpinus]PKH37727.1 phosphate ABC transporter substrate-binding protein PstS [Nocardioides alpinus]SFA84234.1 phosphate transport system substrate-binding protein [Nocardioides alpinus]
MNRTSIRKALAPSVAVLALSITLTACGAGNETTDSGSDDSSSAETGTLTGELNGAGASSQEKAMEAWSVGFQGLNPDVTLNYNPLGSGDGRTQFIEGGTLFAGTDSAFDDEEGELTAANERCGTDIIQVPSYVSPIAVMFNLEGVDSLQLDAATIAGIFDGKITSWDDPAIADLNPDADLPATDISPVHRQDDSGTTENFTDYLSQASDGAWPHEPDGLWPVKGGLAAEGTSGVVAAVTNGNGTIGYADASQVGELSVVDVKVGEEYVAPTAEAAAKVVAVSPPVEGATETDMAVEVDRTTTEAGAYPVILLSYLVACQTYETQEDADLVKAFMEYVVSDEGQAAAAENAGSAPLDAETATRAQDIVSAIAAG